ncbi:MAG: hypothetical protein KKC99_04490, partial [Proteobacteria bacterium]|nr:hypothetical protein [Pseudomonadota bacterium]
ALVALTCLTMPLVFRLLRDNSIDRAASELSYPFYLVHYLVIALLEQTLEDAPPALMLSCTLGATLLLWVVAIRPFRKFTPKPTRSEPFVISPIPASIPALVPVQPDSTPQM